MNLEGRIMFMIIVLLLLYLIFSEKGQEIINNIINPNIPKSSLDGGFKFPTDGRTWDTDGSTRT